MPLCRLILLKWMVLQEHKSVWIRHNTLSEQSKQYQANVYVCQFQSYLTLHKSDTCRPRTQWHSCSWCPSLAVGNNRVMDNEFPERSDWVGSSGEWTAVVVRELHATRPYATSVLTHRSINVYPAYGPFSYPDGALKRS